MDKVILAQIKQTVLEAQSIAINVHRNPDLDSLGSSEALGRAISTLGKDVVRISPDPIPEAFSFLKGSAEVQVIDFNTYDFSRHDLLIVLDTGSVSHLIGQRDGVLPKIKTIVIDHHAISTVPGTIRLIDIKVSSSAEIIYALLKEWDITIDQQIATALLAGILSDTMMFRFSGTNTRVMETVIDLIKKGGDMNSVIYALFGHIELFKAKLYGAVLSGSTFDAGRRSVVSFIDLQTYTTYGSPKGVRDTAADYLRGIEGADFAVIGIEEKPEQLFLSFRSKTVDVSKFAAQLGGGGHKQAAGATVYAPFEEAKKRVMEVLSTCH